MMVKQVIKLLKEAEVISVGLGDQAIRIDPHDSVMLDVFGDYVVDCIFTDDGKMYELGIAMKPIRGDRANAC